MSEDLHTIAHLIERITRFEEIIMSMQDDLNTALQTVQAANSALTDKVESLLTIATDTADKLSALVASDAASSQPTDTVPAAAVQAVIDGLHAVSVAANAESAKVDAFTTAHSPAPAPVAPVATDPVVDITIPTADAPTAS